MRADVVIVGSGPGGVSVAEQLAESAPHLSVLVIERGPLLLRQHFYDTGGTIHERDALMAERGVCPWRGDLAAGGGLFPVLGGRGVLGGAQLHRFYDADLTAWPDGVWPVSVSELAPLFDRAERRLLGSTRTVGAAQDELLAALGTDAAHHPPTSRDAQSVASPAGGHSHRSSVERLLALAGNREGDGGSPQILDTARVVGLVDDGGDPATVTGVRVRSGAGDDEFVVEAGAVVLAASPVESTRLVLLSGLPVADAVGRYLAEHIYLRGVLDVSDVPQLHGSTNVFLPPASADLDDRFHVELRSLGPDESGRWLMRATCSIAMDPDRSNRVTLAPERDEFGVRVATTRMQPTSRDRARTARAVEALEDARQRIGARWAVSPHTLSAGGSYHEGGTLRIGASGTDRAADEHARILGSSNLFTADAAAFPTVGVANPILTITAMGYRLAEYLAAR